MAGLPKNEHDPDVQQVLFEDVGSHAQFNLPDDHHAQNNGAVEGPTKAGKAGDSLSEEEQVPTCAELKEQIALKKKLEKEI